MRLTKRLYKTISHHFNEYAFVEGSMFKWSPSTKTITVQFDDPTGVERLLHEIAHAELMHKNYSYDVRLVMLERDAWKHAQTVLAPLFSLSIDNDIIQDDLDSYREWMHKRSTCPTCSATGIQSNKHTYRCIHCSSLWTVNTARGCALRRYKIPT